MRDESLFSKQRGAGDVLVVDDERPIREMLDRWLRAGGYRSKTAADVTEALDTIAGNSIDLVITDINMPGQSGFDLLQSLQSRGLNVPVLMLTACEDPRFAAQAMTQGACGYLLKPVQLKDLLFQVARALERRKQLADAQSRMQRLENQVCEQMRLVRMAHEEVIHRLVVASVVRDDETGAHIKRIGAFSAALAAAAGWSSEAVHQIRLAAPMHDIGKIGIPDAILLKPGALTAKEHAIMQSHTLIGAGILKNAVSPEMQLAETIARSHHERWDGTGYPDCMQGQDIPEAARIVAIVDVFDSLSHKRVYRPAMSEAETLRILRDGRARHFDPDLLDLFFETLPVIQELARRDEHPEPTENGFSPVDALHTFQGSASLDSALNRQLIDNVLPQPSAVLDTVCSHTFNCVQ